MVMNIIYFVCGVVFPYFLEEYGYRRWVATDKKQNVDATIAQRYGWRILWDAAYFSVLLYSAQRIISPGVFLSEVEWLGYGIFLCGAILRIWALRSLGQFYDSGIAIQVDHQLVRAGPYQVLRHPLHLGTLWKITGLALLCPIWLAFLTISASFLLTLYLNRKEDQTHLLEFDSSFNEYYRSTWDIVDLFFWKNIG